MKFQCTANIRDPFDGNRSERCIRPMGHAGLHRFYSDDQVHEFSNSEAWFPNYSISPNLKKRAEDEDWRIREG